MPEGKATFADHLSHYNVPDDAVSEQLVSSDCGAVDDASKLGFHTLETTDLAQVKAWIGNADSLFASGDTEDAYAAHPCADTAPDEADEATLVDAAKGYVYGHSDRFEPFKKHIESKLGPFKIQVLATKDVVIKPGHPLIFSGSTPKVLTADKITFEGDTAQLISYVNLTVKATTVEMQS